MLMSPVDAVEFVVGLFAGGSVGALHEGAVGALRQWLSLDRTEVHVDIGQVAEGQLGGLGALALQGHQTLLALAQDVCFEATAFLQIDLVFLEVGVMEICLVGLLVQRE